MTNVLSEIRKILKNKTDERAKESIKKFIPTVKKYYGVRTPVLNNLANRFKGSGFSVVEALWKSVFTRNNCLLRKF